MKRNLWILSLLVFLLGSTWAGAADQTIAFVNLDRVFNEHPKTKKADAQLKEQADLVMKDRKDMIAAYEKLQEDFNDAREAAQNPAFSEEKRDTKRTEAEDTLVALREQEAKVRRFDESRRKQLDEQSRRMRKGIVEEIRTLINDYASKQGYTTVLDSSGQSFNTVEIVLYVDPKVDITEAIIAEVVKSGETK